MNKTATPITLALSLLLSAPALAGGADYAAPTAPAPVATPVAAPAQVYEPIVIPARSATNTAPAAPAQAEAVASLDSLSGAELLELAVKANDAEGLEGSYSEGTGYVVGEDGELIDIGLLIKASIDLKTLQSKSEMYQAGEIAEMEIVSLDGGYSFSPSMGTVPLPRQQAWESIKQSFSGAEGLALAKLHPELVTIENDGSATWIDGKVKGHLLTYVFSEELGGGDVSVLLNDKGVIIAERFEDEDVGMMYVVYGDEGPNTLEAIPAFLEDGTPFMVVEDVEYKRNPTFAPDTFEVPSE